MSLVPGVFGSVVVFAVFGAVSLQDLPYASPDRLVALWEDNSGRSLGLTPTSYLNYRDLSAETSALVDVAAYSDIEFNLTGGAASERVRGLYSTWNLLSLTGIEPLIGRTFQEADDLPGSPDVAVLSYPLWQQSFGADPDAVGQTILLNDRSYVVVGVMPRGFVLPPGFSATVVSAEMVMRPPDLWVPLKPEAEPTPRNMRYLFMLGRVRQDRTLAQAQAELDTVASRLATQFPDANRGLRLAMLPLQGQVMGSLGAVVPLFGLAAGLVLLVAGMNAFAVSLAAAAYRSHEWAVRVALGATPLQMYRQALGSGMTVALAAGVFGSALAYVCLTALRASGDSVVSGLANVRFDGWVWLFAVALSVVLGFALAVVPVVVMRRAGLRQALSSEDTRSTGSRRSQLMRRGVLVLQVSLAVVVVTVALQLVSTFNRLSAVNPGLDSQDVVTLEFTLPDNIYSEQGLKTRFQRDLLDAVEAVPGVESAATVDYVPFGENIAIVNLTVDALVPQPADEPPRALWRTVSEGYFRTLSMPLVEGRAFSAADRIDTTAVAVVNTEFVRQFYGDGQALGKRIKRGRADSDGAWMTVVGVTGAVRSTGLGVAPQPEILVPYTQWGRAESLTLMARTGADPDTTARAIGQVSSQVDPRVPPSGVRYLEAMIAESLGGPRFQASLLAVFAGLALVLALAGTYGLSAALVSIRQREIGLRVCLGARAGDMMRTVAGESLGCVLIGTLAGLASAVVAAGGLSSVFVGVDATEATPYLVSGVLMLVTGVLVNVGPVRRAMATEPASMLTEGAGRTR